MLLINNEPCYSPDPPKLTTIQAKFLNVGQAAQVLDLQTWNLLWLTGDMDNPKCIGGALGALYTLDLCDAPPFTPGAIRAALRKHPIQCAKELVESFGYIGIFQGRPDMYEIVTRRAHEAASRWNSEKVQIDKVTDEAEVAKLVAVASNVRQFRRVAQ